VTRQPNLLVAAILALAINSVAQHASAAVVFGNLGANGVDPLAASTNAGISDSTWLMHGFTVGSPDNILQTVRLGLADNDSTTARVQILSKLWWSPVWQSAGNTDGDRVVGHALFPNL